jgi:hypothetical protein
MEKLQRRQADAREPFRRRQSGIRPALRPVGSNKHDGPFWNAPVLRFPVLDVGDPEMIIIVFLELFDDRDHTSGRTANVAGISSIAGYSGAQWAGGPIACRADRWQARNESLQTVLGKHIGLIRCGIDRRG